MWQMKKQLRMKVIVNPKAGRKLIQQNLEPIIGRLIVSGTVREVDVFHTTAREDAMREAARLKSGEYDLLLAAGGDGTINEVINGLMQGGADIPLAVLAAGTVNDFSYAMGLPTKPDEYADMIAEFYTRRIDLGLANGRYFANVAAFGVFSDVPLRTKQADKNSIGRYAYYLQALRDLPFELYASRKMLVEVEFDGQKLVDGFGLCMVGNTTSVGGIRTILGDAKPDDGLLDVLLFRHPYAAAQGVVHGLKSLEFPPGATEYLQARSLRFNVISDEPRLLDLDGEEHGTLPAEISVVPQALTLLVPRPLPPEEAEMPMLITHLQ
ncbi:MAG: diacylglycerol kinase family lipid kinase [Firmicutes bacterium]|nr:diacylglycerol kinase family lipid kinase [Bacillota bacterium]